MSIDSLTRASSVKIDAKKIENIKVGNFPPLMNSQDSDLTKLEFSLVDNLEKYDYSVAFVALGSDILNGKADNDNLNFLACYLTKIGYNFAEARIVASEQEIISSTIEELSGKYSIVIVSGGVDSANDGVVSLSVAKAMKREYITNDERKEMLERSCCQNGEELSEAQLQMAKMPEGAEVIRNESRSFDMSGFRVDNVYCLSGISTAFKDVTKDIIHNLPHRAAFVSKAIITNLTDGLITQSIEGIQLCFSDLYIDSYSSKTQNNEPCVRIVIRGKDSEKVQTCYEKVALVLKEIEEIANSNSENW